ncbi:MAG: hypothetical protein RBT66_07800 [bacterium]|jgi:hypothetical protein|nr:hypothetical protein [bacterium]
MAGIEVSTGELVGTLRTEGPVERLVMPLLGKKHTGMKISAEGILGRIATGRYWKGLDYGCEVMLDHLERMAERFYAGDPTAVDEFLQLYDLADKRPAA